MREALGSYTPRVLPLDYDSASNRITAARISAARPSPRWSPSPGSATSILTSSWPRNSTSRTPFSTSLDRRPQTRLRPSMRHGRSGWGRPGCASANTRTSFRPTTAGGNSPRSIPRPSRPRFRQHFDGDGLLNIAIQKSPATIEIKRYITTTEIATVSFTGESPVMIFTGLVYHSNIPDQEDVGCLYLRAERPNPSLSGCSVKPTPPSTNCTSSFRSRWRGWRNSRRSGKPWCSGARTRREPTPG
jgi:hypothetical protein